MKWNRFATLVGALLCATVSAAQDLPDGAIRVQGDVVDAETGDRIEKFRLIVGSPYNDIHTTWQGHLVSDHAGGKYTWRNDRPWRKTRLRIEAAGYRPATSPTLEKGAGELSINFKLKRDLGFRGVVHDPAGEPLSGAQVAMTTQTLETNVSGGKLSYTSGTRLGAKVATTDSRGRFKLAAESDAFLIVAAHREHGFAVFEKSDLARGPDSRQRIVIQLQPWSRVEGQCVDSEGKPQINVQYALSVGWQRKPEWPVLNHRSKATTDKDGNFVFEYVAAGTHFLQQWDRPDANGARSAGVTYRIAAIAGKSMRLNVGSQFRPIKGRLSVANDVLPNDFDFRDLTISISPASRPLRGRLVLLGKRNQSVKVHVPVNERGEFEAEELAPGNYHAVIGTKPGSQAAKWNLRVNYTLTIPLVDEAEQDKPHDLGDLKMYAKKLGEL